MEWFFYLLKVSASMALFFTLYLLFLQRLTFFALSRGYLLVSLAMSILVPALQMEIKQTRPVSETRDIYEGFFMAAQSPGLSVSPKTKHTSPVIHATGYDWIHLLYNVYWLVTIIMLLGFMAQMAHLLKSMRQVSRHTEGLKIICKPSGFTNCSFFNYVFIAEEGMTDEEIAVLLTHERAHALLYHSVDKLFVTICKAMLWFNPFVYLFGRALEQVHEYQADYETTLRVGDTYYANLLLAMSVKKNHLVFVHNFVENPLKGRIRMLFANKSKNRKKFLYLAGVPLLAVLFCSFSIRYVDQKKEGPKIGAANFRKVQEKAISQDTTVNKPKTKKKREELNRKKKILGLNRDSTLKEEKVLYSAKDSTKFNKDRSIIFLYGQASIKSRRFEVQADKIEFNSKTKTAEGINVTIRDLMDNKVIKGAYGKLNLENNTYEIKGSPIF